MDQPKYKIGDTFFLLHCKPTFEKDRMYDYEPQIAEYVISGIEQRKAQLSDSRVRMTEPIRVTYTLAGTCWHNSVKEITEGMLDKIYAKTADEAKAKALIIIESAEVVEDEYFNKA